MKSKLLLVAALLTTANVWAAGPENNSTGAGVGAIGASTDDSCLCNLHPGMLIETTRGTSQYNDLLSGPGDATPTTKPDGVQ